MIADAVHSLSDFITDIIVIAFVHISGKPSDKGHDYGHGKYETLATLLIGLILIMAGMALMYNGITKVIDSITGNMLPRPTMLALAIAVLSVVAKEWLFRYTRHKGEALQSPAVTANAWHHRSDAISSIGTLIGISGAMFLGSRWRILDPIAAILVSLFIISAGYKIIKPCISELLEASLPEETELMIEHTVTSVPGIIYVHNLRSRRLGSNVVIDLHAKMDGNITLNEAHTIATQAEEALKRKFGAHSIINIHMEPTTRQKKP